MIEKQVLRGFLANVEVNPPLIVTFQFNPESISDNKAVNYAERYASLSEDTPGKVYTGGGDRTISFEIQLHGLEQGTNALNPAPVDNGISTELAKLRSFLYPRADAWSMISSGEEGRRISSPPTCVFGFGTKILECVVTGMNITETQFNSALAPVRAEVKITLTVIEEKDNKFHTLDRAHRNALAAMGIQNIRPF
jgi:hypothetical protein